jgi:methylated-DNA-protein-cysteine methyltransferase-like protein
MCREKNNRTAMNYVHPPNKQLYYEQVWALVRRIPYGRVATYGQIAKILPKPEAITAEDFQLSASRWVGSAMAACPADVPWQRVINSQGKISHQSEAGKQKQLLEGEGVLFSKEKLDLLEYQWRGPGQNDGPMQGRLF